MSKHDLHNMAGLDLYLSSLSNEEYEKVRANIQRSSRTRFPLISWDVFSQGHNKQINTLARDRDRKNLDKLKDKYSWNYDFDTLNLETSNYHAIVITGAELNIVWVSPGFVTMTGYTAQYAKGRAPGFLQGHNTSAVTRANIKSALSRGKHVEASLINYRKNGEEYICEVNIRPLFNNDNKITHFIALEREIA